MPVTLDGMKSNSYIGLSRQNWKPTQLSCRGGGECVGGGREGKVSGTILDYIVLSSEVHEPNSKKTPVSEKASNWSPVHWPAPSHSQKRWLRFYIVLSVRQVITQEMSHQKMFSDMTGGDNWGWWQEDGTAHQARGSDEVMRPDVISFHTSLDMESHYTVVCL